MSLPAPNPDRTCLVTGASSGIGRRSPGSSPPGAWGSPWWPGPRRSCGPWPAPWPAGTGSGSRSCPTDLTDADARSALPGRRRGARAVRQRAGQQRRLLHPRTRLPVGPRPRDRHGPHRRRGRRPPVFAVHRRAWSSAGAGASSTWPRPQRSSPSRARPATGRRRRSSSPTAMPSARSSARRGCRSPRCAPGRSRPGSPRRRASPPRRWPAAMPRVFWVPAAEVAKVGVQGMDDNRAVVIPGLPNKVSAAVRLAVAPADTAAAGGPAAPGPPRRLTGGGRRTRAACGPGWTPPRRTCG